MKLFTVLNRVVTVSTANQ